MLTYHTVDVFTYYPSEMQLEIKQRSIEQQELHVFTCITAIKYTRYAKHQLSAVGLSTFFLVIVLARFQCQHYLEKKLSGVPIEIQLVRLQCLLTDYHEARHVFCMI